jgi:uncharacterized Zn finger protein (UPF0148 family)
MADERPRYEVILGQTCEYCKAPLDGLNVDSVDRAVSGNLILNGPCPNCGKANEVMVSLLRARDES